MTDLQPLDILRASPLFSGLERTTLERMARALTPERWPKHTEILPAAYTARRFVIIGAGRVKVVVGNARNGRELTLWLLGPGDGLDVVGLLDGQPHAVSAWTLDEVQALSGPVPLLREWLEKYAAFRLAMYRFVARQLRSLAELAGDLALHDTTTRLARLLLRHVSGHARSRGSNRLYELPHEELAGMIGSVRVVVNRVLARLRRESVIDLHAGRVSVIDLNRLLRRAEEHLGQLPARAADRRRARQK